MAKVMRNGAGHASDGRQSLGVKQLSLGLLDRPAHPVEGGSQLRDFVVPSRLERISEVTALERMHAPHQVCERAGERSRNQEHERAAGEHCRQAYAQNPAVQTLEERGRLIVRLEHAQANGRSAARGELHRSREELLATQLNVLRSRGRRKEAFSLALQVRLLGGGKCADYDRLSVPEGGLARGDSADVCSHAIVDLVPHRQNAQRGVLRGGTEINGLEENLKEVAAAKPPVAGLAVTERAAQESLGFAPAQ